MCVGGVGIIETSPKHCLEFSSEVSWTLYASQNYFHPSYFIPLQCPVQVDRKTWPKEEDKTPYSDFRKPETKGKHNKGDEGSKAQKQ